nr:hypothetical protein Iba_chr04dCG12690 [Ipomoea batatas]
MSPSASTPSGGSSWCSRDSKLVAIGKFADCSCVETLVVRITFPPRFTTCSSSSAARLGPLLCVAWPDAPPTPSGNRLPEFAAFVISFSAPRSRGTLTAVFASRVSSVSKGPNLDPDAPVVSRDEHPRSIGLDSRCRGLSVIFRQSSQWWIRREIILNTIRLDPGGSATGISELGVSATVSSRTNGSISESDDDDDPPAASDSIAEFKPAPSFDFFVLRSNRSSSSEYR